MYLTNSMEPFETDEGGQLSFLPMIRGIVEEGRAAGYVKERVPVLVVPAAGRAAEPYRTTRSFLTPPVASRSRGISARPLLVHPDPYGADRRSRPCHR